MDKKIDEILYDSLRPADEPDADLNRQILDRRLKRNMRKFNMRKTAVAAAVGILVAVGGVSAYAASHNLSLLSLFDGQSKEVKEEAGKLLETKIQQKPGENKEQSQLVNFRIRESIADKNLVKIQVAAKAVEADKYLLVPTFSGEDMPVSDLGIEDLSSKYKKMKIGEYAKSIGKECLFVEAVIGNDDSSSQGIDNHMEKDGTLLFNISIDNTKKSDKLDYVCETFVYPPGGDLSHEDILRDKVSFSLTDKTKSEVTTYLPVKKGKVPGTDLVIDEVTFEKSALEMVCNVKYHYAGKSKHWENTVAFDTAFEMLDSKGNRIETSEGGGGYIEDEINVTQSYVYSLRELPETVTFQARDVMEKKLFGTMDVKLVKSNTP